MIFFSIKGKNLITEKKKKNLNFQLTEDEEESR